MVIFPVTRRLAGVGVGGCARVGGSGCGCGGGCCGWVGYIDGDLYGGHFLVPLFVVSSVDQYFIEYLIDRHMTRHDMIRHDVI